MTVVESKIEEVNTDIVEVEETVYELNKSYQFLLPLLELKHPNLNILNTYIKDLKTNYEYALYLLLKGDPKELRSNQNYIDSYIVENNKSIYVFEIPNRFKKDYDNFIEGKYSEFSPDAKYILCKAAAGKSKKIEDTFIYGILKKTDARRKYIEELVGEKLPKDAELCSIPNLSKEIYE